MESKVKNLTVCKSCGLLPPKNGIKIRKIEIPKTGLNKVTPNRAKTNIWKRIDGSKRADVDIHNKHQRKSPIRK